MAAGHADLFTLPEKTCVFMPTHGPEKYLVCEAPRSITHSNSMPRSQDFSFASGALFLMYEPPQGTGYTQYYYAIRAK